MAANDAPTRSIGSTVMSGYGPWSAWDAQRFEHVPDMVWPASVAVITRMRTDATVASILAAYIGPLVAANWAIDPKGADPRAVAVCADSFGLPVKGEDGSDIGAARRRGVKFKEHVRLASLHLPYGHVGFEDTYEIRADGYAYLATLQERLPSTIASIDVNADGTLKSITQEGSDKPIPAKRLLWYCHLREGANWAGTSLLRPAYANWLLKLDTLRVNAIGIARFGAGTPVMEPLPGVNVTPAQITEAQRLASAVRVGETGGAVPNGFTLRIKGVEGTLPDALPTLNYYDQQIARSCLTSLLDLGNTATGSRALGDNFADMLQRSLQAVADYMAETASQICARLTEFNFGESAVSPVVTAGDVGASKAAIAASIAGLVTAGLITPDTSLESFVRDGYHLPPKDPTPQAPPNPDAVPPNSGGGQEDVTLAASGWQPWVHAAEGGWDKNRGNAEQLRRWYTHGGGAAIIRWGTENDHARCVALASKHMTVEQAHGYCNLREKEATGEYPAQHAKRVRGAESDPQPYRGPTPAEQAAGIDPQQVDEAQDSLVAEGMTLFAAITAVWGAALAAQITATLTAGSLAGLAKLTVDSTDAAQGLAVLMREAADAGIATALGEATRAGIPKPALKPAVDEAALDDAAAGIADLAGQGLASAAGREAARIAGPDSDPKTIARQAVATVTESDTPIHDAIAAGVTRAMGAGRAAAQQALTVGADLVPFASAIRDLNSCQPCLDNDGHEYPDLAAALADFPTGHYAACLGRARCRCQIHLRPVMWL